MTEVVSTGLAETSGATGTEATFPLPRPCPFDAPAEYERLRVETPISRVSMVAGGAAWLVTRHEDVRAVLSDPRFSADRRRPGFPQFAPGQNAVAARRSPSMISLDGAEHATARRAVISEFSVKRIAALAPRIQQIVDGFVDAMLAGDRPADLVEALSLPVPSMVICELLGVPYTDHDYFQARTKRFISRNATEQDRITAFDELREYLDRLVVGKEAEPGDDVLGRQIRRQREQGGVDHESLVSLAVLLLVAGHETTANMISLGVVGLLDNPDQLAAIKADPGRTPLAVEELLRYWSIVDSATSRVAMEDVEIGGVRIRAGEGVIAPALAANRDTSVFGDADELDIERGARHHVAFGYGPHQCLGQNLARLELQIVFDTLFRRIPDLRLAVEIDEVPFKDDANIYGVYRLPVTW